MRDYCFSYRTEDTSGIEIFKSTNIDNALEQLRAFMGTDDYDILAIYSEPCFSK